MTEGTSSPRVASADRPAYWRLVDPRELVVRMEAVSDTVEAVIEPGRTLELEPKLDALRTRWDMGYES